MDKTPSQIRSALRRILKPLIRILLRFGYSHREFNQLAKQLFVEVCYADFAIEGRKMTASRAAVLTGLDRKEIVKLLKASEDQHIPSSRPINRASRVIGGWLRDKEYLDERGKPKIIPLKGGNISLESLVKKYGGDITVAPILDELIRIGAVVVNDDSQIELRAEGYMPVSDDLQMLNLMGDSAEDLFTTIAYNLEKPKHPRFQRAVVYSQLSERSIDEFKLVSHDKCQQLLLELNDWLATKLELDSRLEVTQDHSRVGVGIYYIEDLAPSQQEETTTEGQPEVEHVEKNA